MGLAFQIALGIILVPVLLAKLYFAVLLGIQLSILFFKGVAWVVPGAVSLWHAFARLLTPATFPVARGIRLLNGRWIALPSPVQVVLIPIVIMLFLGAFVFLSYPALL